MGCVMQCRTYHLSENYKTFTTLPVKFNTLHLLAVGRLMQAWVACVQDAKALLREISAVQRAAALSPGMSMSPGSPLQESFDTP